MAKATLSVVRETQFKVEKGIEPPKKGGAARMSWPFDKMEVDDSFAIDGPRELVDRCRAAASYYGARTQQRFSICRVEDGGYRCWRVE